MKMTHVGTFSEELAGRLSVEPEVYKEAQVDMSRSAEVIRRVMIWINKTECRKTPWGRIARLIAAQREMCPSAMEHKSFRQIERETNGMIRNDYLCRLAKEFRNEFGLK
jgi:hypothetical protein